MPAPPKVLSFHPLITAWENRLCAGRDPGPEDRAAIQRALAVILPQGCRKSLFRMARDHCPRVFPNYEARFAYPGKLGQQRLFASIQAPMPATRCFANVRAYEEQPYAGPFPCVFKFDWGGQGRTVHRADGPQQIEELVCRARECESTGQAGFLIQEYVDCGNRCLRVVALHDTLVSYWRVGRGDFGTALDQGGMIDQDGRPELQEQGRRAVRRVQDRTGIDLAGFDLIFARDEPEAGPLFLEINWFFGRQGLGGSSGYYRLLENAVGRWIRQQVPGVEHGQDTA